MKGISKAAHAGLSPLIPAVLALPEVMVLAPSGFIPPPLNPTGARLETKELAPGIYGLLSNKPPVDNSGFVVGEHGVLVIDAHLNGAMAGQIQTAVRQVTNKPILYVVNTNYHGDHTFGNYAFPQETLIVAQQKTAESMRDFEREKQFLLPIVDNDPTVFGDVRLRLPDLVFDQYLELDLGGRVVELYHFGHGNTPGDTVVFVPEARIAWVGNLIVGEGSIVQSAQRPNCRLARVPDRTDDADRCQDEGPGSRARHSRTGDGVRFPHGRPDQHRHSRHERRDAAGEMVQRLARASGRTFRICSIFTARKARRRSAMGRPAPSCRATS